eukprot:356578-Chlamydomonas_euryale.AAC.1
MQPSQSQSCRERECSRVRVRVAGSGNAAESESEMQGAGMPVLHAASGEGPGAKLGRLVPPSPTPCLPLIQSACTCALTPSARRCLAADLWQVVRVGQLCGHVELEVGVIVDAGIAQAKEHARALRVWT